MSNKLEMLQTATEAYGRRFWPRVNIGSDSECWPWIGNKDRDGYGRFRMRAHGIQRAHRAVFALRGEKIAQGLVVDHICHNRSCVNPAHLRIVTPIQNTLENSIGVAAVNALKNTCVNGHELMGHNLILRKKRRQCRTCQNARVSRYKKSKRLADGMVECLKRVVTP